MDKVSFIKSIARILICITFLIGMCVLFSFLIKRPPVYSVYKIQDAYNDVEESNYYEAIAFGTLKQWATLSGIVIHPDPVVQEIPTESVICCHVGYCPKQTALYEVYGDIVSLPDDVYIISFEQTENGILLEYYILGYDQLCFTGSVFDYYTIKVGDSFELRFSTDTVEIVEKELIDGIGKFYTPIGDYFYLYQSGCLMQRLVGVYYDVYYIENDFLTEKVGTNQYCLHVMNKYQENTNSTGCFYDKIITVQPFDDTYSIITSNNVNAWEMIYFYGTSK